jgi:arginase
MTKSITLIGAPVDEGARRRGCLMGPDMLRTAGLGRALVALGHDVNDAGDIAAAPYDAGIHPNETLYELDTCAGWIAALTPAVRDHASKAIPIVMGGDHLMSAGVVPGVAARAADQGRPQFVLWLDAHSDFHDLNTTGSGNLHGTPVAYYCGRDGFTPHFPAVEAPIDPANILMLGLRSVDQAEKDKLRRENIALADMRVIDEEGIAAPLARFLDQVEAANGHLHVSLDVDFLDPAIAPAVGTTVPGGATFREAHLVMETLNDSDLVTSVDIAELNPYLDNHGCTADLLVDLISSLFGKRVLDRPTRGRRQ